ncbi:MAG: helix-turn-helix transcriptional regulator [Magnetococcales bacterium]|nr:helix-turn-helix transcriptional regulator [Magnetococcales bacterium]
MGTFFDRLQEERRRLGMNQAEFATIGGVGRTAQINYESGDRRPTSEYLIAIAAAGADVNYILTGQRSAGLGLDGHPDVSAEDVLGVTLVIETVLRQTRGKPTPQEKVAMIRLACEKSTPDERRAMVNAMHEGVCVMPVSIAKLFRFDAE